MFQGDYQQDPIKHMTFWLLIGLDSIVVAFALHVLANYIFTVTC